MLGAGQIRPSSRSQDARRPGLRRLVRRRGRSVSGKDRQTTIPRALRGSAGLEYRVPSWQLSDVLSLDRNPLVVRKDWLLRARTFQSPSSIRRIKVTPSEVRPRGRVRLG